MVVTADISRGRPVLSDVTDLVPEGDDNGPDAEVRLSFPEDENFMWEETAIVERDVVVDDEYSDRGCWRRPKWPVFMSMTSTISRIITKPSRNEPKITLPLFHGGCAGSPESPWIG